MPREVSSKNIKTDRTTLRQDVKNAEQQRDLRTTINRLQRQLDAAKSKTGDLVAAVERAVCDAAQAIEVPRVPWSGRGNATRARTHQDGERAIVVVSDLQLAKVTPTYNTAVAEARMQAYAEKVIQLTKIQRHDHPVDEARVYLLGDIVEGELIFPHQAHQIDASLYRQVAVDGPRILVNFLRTLLANFRAVHVVGVIGNHGQLGGRAGRQYNPETNADRMLYKFVQELLRDEPRVSWHVPDARNERSWYAVDYPFAALEQGARPLRMSHEHGFLLFHGDQIPGSANHSVGTIAKHIYGWASGAVAEPFDYAIYGHWHTPRRFQLNKYVAFCNGSLESTNTYAQEKLAAVGTPTQLLLFVHPRQGVSAEYWVKL